jgi:hypothetical protein
VVAAEVEEVVNLVVGGDLVAWINSVLLTIDTQLDIEVLSS